MLRFSINFENIDKIVLSHEHSDHIGGFNILDKLGEVKIYILNSFSKRFKNILSSYSNANLKKVTKMKKIRHNIFTTGEIGSIIKEQSLVIKKRNNLMVLTGCSHPGLENILKIASRLGNIHGVIGGFHGFNKLESLGKMSLIIPCHCTARKREILTLYPKTSMECSAGCRIEL